MRTTQDLLEYVDRMIDIGVDRTEMPSFTIIDLEPASGEGNGISGTRLAPLVINADEHEGMDGDGI
ncbi:MAG TPA: hypothetical protein VH280_19105 [Verrucomicrobiae bacterium]|jgi:hypothetical protein|nr:hypothetical protein [Verrucomicrobiae bacterium]